MTAAKRAKVEKLVACGMSQDDIARALGITAPTLRKHFEEELAIGVAKKRGEVIELLFKQAKSGNVAAIKKLEEMTRAASADESVKGRTPTTPSPGKKEQQQAAAERVSGKFAPPSAPQLVVNND